MPLSAGQKLGPYEILAPIGEGGMGEVYKARDERLGRTVAVKRLKGEHSARFEREARAIAALNHPNICALHDIGADYLVMEYVEGEPLQGPVTLEEAVKLAIQIASALEEAHERGILHRDLKPTNILVTRKGVVKLLDFGLAKLMTDAGADGTQTIEGTVLGTACYMSPEQAQGQPLDERSDVFSFGAVLYELLSGRRAFGQSSILEALNAVVSARTAPLDSPAAEIVRRCMAKQASQRFQSMGEVKAALEQLGAARGGQEQPSIAVLPFANLGGNTEDEYFSDGLAEEIINALAQIPELKVIARTSAFSFKGKNEDIRRIAESLAVTHILEGSVRRAGNRVRVTAQLIQATDGTHLWSQRYEREMNDVFALQDEMSAAIAEQLKVRLSGRKRATTNVGAYQAYLEGRYHSLKMSPESAARAHGFFQQAIALDPEYAPAHVGMAEYFWMIACFGFIEPKQALALVQAEARRAVELDESQADGHGLLGCARMALDYDWAACERHWRRGLELNPASLSACLANAYWYWRAQGAPEKGLQVIDQALEHDPRSPALRLGRCEVLLFMRRYAEAEMESQRALAIDPRYMGAQLVRTLARSLQQRHEEALASAQEMVQAQGRWSWPLLALGITRAHAGQLDEARELLGELEGIQPRTAVQPYFLASLYGLLGDLDLAFQTAERAIEERHPFIVLAKSSPLLDPLRNDPRFPALLARMNLA